MGEMEERNPTKTDASSEAPLKKLKPAPCITVLEDLTFGMLVDTDTKFNQSWKVKNSGTEPWPNECYVICTTGNQPKNRIPIKSLQPGEECVITLELISCSTNRRFLKTNWLICAPGGVFFPELLQSLTVVEKSDMSLAEEFYNLTTIEPTPIIPQRTLDSSDDDSDSDDSDDD